MSAHASAPIALLTPAGGTITVVHGRKNVCLAIRTGRGGISSLDLTEVGRDQLLTAMLDWKYVEDELPDDNTTVLLALERDTDEPWHGYHEDGEWKMADGMPVIGSINRVYAWAHVPGMPPRRSIAPGAPSTLKPLVRRSVKGGAL